LKQTDGFVIRSDTKDSERTRERLIDAATRLFAVHGFDGATAEQIAGEAGVNKAMINYHFGGKQGLYQAILTGTLDRAGAALREIRHADLPSDEKLARYIEAFASLHRDRPTISAMLLRELLSGGRFVDAALLPRFLELFASIREIIAGGVRDGSFRPVNPLLTHFSLIGSMVFFYATAPFRERLLSEGKFAGAAPSEAEFIGHLEELFGRGLRAEQPPAHRSQP
jgi:TetR/AcrR family transcriptional regulator